MASYKTGDLVWAKMKGFSPWPGKVAEPKEGVKKPSKKSCNFVYFFGSENYAWIEQVNLLPFFKFREKLVKANKTSTFQDAVGKIEEYIVQNDITPPKESELQETLSNHTESVKNDKKISKKRLSNASDEPSTKKAKLEPKGSKVARVKKREPSLLSPLANSKARVSALLDRPVHIQRPCLDFVNAGAKEMMTPSDVVAAADITFCCVSDPTVTKNIMFGNCGVLQEINSDKGYVEMTGVDAEASQDLAEAVAGKGGRYLEAQIQGSKTQAEQGTLIILAAGDRSLFDDCQSCFQAMGKNSFYLGEVGNASKMNLVLQVMTGITLVGLAEGMALADRAGLQQKDVLEILELTSLAAPLLVEKGKAIIEGGFPTHLPLQHMQKDLRLVMIMGDSLELPLPLTAATNEMFKHAKRLGYAEHDVSSVYIRTRF